MTTQEFQSRIADLAPESVSLVDGTVIVTFHSGDQVHIPNPPLIEFTDETGIYCIQDTSI